MDFSYTDHNAKLYLDDLRTPVTEGWTVVRSFEEATSYIELHGIPSMISFDHDLGDGKTGYDFAKWLVECDLSRRHVFPKHFKFNVHSANPVGKKNIESYLTPYLDFKYNNDK